MRKSVQIASLLVGAALFGGVAMPTWAVDGVILIDQNKAMAGNVTPGDAPGFPVTISLPGSYRLAGNLTVPDANTNAILITADHVTIDLNGFAILGPADCSGGLEPCANNGGGNGITTLGLIHFNITVRNGTIQGMGAEGIALRGDSHLVENMHVRSNGKGGIDILSSSDDAGSIVQHNTVQRNGGNGGGISLGRGLVSHNVIDVNSYGIIIFQGGSASHNVISRNLHDGIVGNMAYSDNVLSGNGRNVGTQPINMGQNLCDNAACPLAQF